MGNPELSLIHISLKEPTSLNLIFPECYLSSDNSARINRVIEKQKEYISGGIFRKVEGTVLVKRNTLYGNERWGLMLSLIHISKHKNLKN